MEFRHLKEGAFFKFPDRPDELFEKVIEKWCAGIGSVNCLEYTKEFGPMEMWVKGTAKVEAVQHRPERGERGSGCRC